MPRFYKLEFPSYSGDEDPLLWLNQCEHFFRGQQTIEEEKFWLAAYHLTGNAQLWYYQLERDESIVFWPRFVDFVNMHFGPPLRSNPLGELAHLWWTGTVQKYQQQFLVLLCRTEQLSSKQQVQLFTTRLCNPLKTDVELQNLSNLQIAMSLARAYEHRREDDTANALPPDRGSFAMRSSTPIPTRTIKAMPAIAGSPEPAPGSTTPSSGSASSVVPAASHGPLLPAPLNSKFRCLTPAEMNNRRLKG